MGDKTRCLPTDNAKGTLCSALHSRHTCSRLYGRCARSATTPPSRHGVSPFDVSYTIQEAHRPNSLLRLELSLVCPGRCAGHLSLLEALRSRGSSNVSRRTLSVAWLPTPTPSVEHSPKHHIRHITILCASPLGTPAQAQRHAACLPLRCSLADPPLQSPAMQWPGGRYQL